jgi:ribosome-associated toxin RatA of RatAB toxin-antitoxin module
MKCQALIKMNVKNLISLVYEIELYPEWMPFATQGRTLKWIDRGSKVCYLKMYCPFISDREMYVYGAGIDRLKNSNKI